jgi:hypothetical protein
LPIGKVATEIGIDRSTLFHWRQDPAFAYAFERELAAQNQLVREATHARLLGLAEKALDVVEAALDAGGASALAAARLVLGRAEAPDLHSLQSAVARQPNPASELSTAELVARARELRKLQASGTCRTDDIGR